MYRITKQEHNDVLGKVYSLANTVNEIPEIIRKWLLDHNNFTTVLWGASDTAFATVKFRGGVEVKFSVSL